MRKQFIPCTVHFFFPYASTSPILFLSRYSLVFFSPIEFLLPVRRTCSPARCKDTFSSPVESNSDSRPIFFFVRVLGPCSPKSSRLQLECFRSQGLPFPRLEAHFIHAKHAPALPLCILSHPRSPQTPLSTSQDLSSELLTKTLPPRHCFRMPPNRIFSFFPEHRPRDDSIFSFV